MKTNFSTDAKVKIIKGNKGFSLVELMVVVAIIGVLAVIGIPQYQKFMSKARQAEAKTDLNAIFQGEASFFTEYNGYSTNLGAIGADAAGTGLRYDAGFGDAAPGPGCTAPVAGSPDGVAGTNNMLTLPNSAGSPATYFWAITDIGAVTSCNSTAGAQAFLAAAWGNPTNSASAPNNANNNGDVFTIDQARSLSHATVGM